MRSLEDVSEVGRLEAFPGPSPISVRRANLSVAEEERRMRSEAPPKSSATGLVDRPTTLRDRVTLTGAFGSERLFMMTVTGVEALDS